MCQLWRTLDDGFRLNGLNVVLSLDKKLVTILVTIFPAV